jgi:acetate kinase
MRTLRASAAPEARQAIDLFIYRIVREIGSLAAALGGLDGLVFTAGIGEHDAATRAEVAAGCGWLGLALDAGLNAGGRGRISVDGTRVPTWVVPTDEERMIARYTNQVIAG